MEKRTIKKLKIYGERNTGTNYFTKLVAKNIDVLMVSGNTPKMKIGSFTLPTGSNVFQNLYFGTVWKSNLGWKHSTVLTSKLLREKDIDSIGFVTITKNPYSFLLSLYKRPYHYKGDREVTFTEFLKNPWVVQGRDNHVARSYENPIMLWNAKNKSYLDLKKQLPEQTFNLTYETIIEDPEKVLKDLQLLWELPGKTNFENHNTSTKESNKSFDYYKDYYLNEQWREKLTEEDISIINRFLDPQVVKFFGYSLL
ncbi:hypothetical protein [Aureisphaera sp.]